MKTKKAFLIKPGKFEISEVELNIKSDEVLVEVAVCGLCNWELNHWKGSLGECPQPLGHEWAGTVVEAGEDVKNVVVGDRVTVLPDDLNGFAKHAVTKGKNCFKLSRDVKLEHAIGEPIKCVVTVLRGAAPEVGDNGVIIGCGPMGLWCVQALAGNSLSSLIAVDIDDEKLTLAQKYGATNVINSKRENVEKRIAEITGGTMADFVVEGTGIPGLLNSALTYLKGSRGRLVLMSSHEEVCKEFDFREAIKRSVEIKVTHPGYSLNPHEDMRRAVSLLNKGTFTMDDIITHKFSFEDINRGFETLEHKPKNYIKGIIFTY